VGGGGALGHGQGEKWGANETNGFLDNTDRLLKVRKPDIRDVRVSSRRVRNSFEDSFVLYCSIRDSFNIKNEYCELKYFF
jgi:hypothetical protein